MKLSQRNEYFDILKGIAILFVIGIHTYPPPQDFTQIGSQLGLIIRQIIVLAVPLFCAISGFFASNKDKSECINFIKQKAPWLFIPALIWSIPYLVYDFYKGYGGINSIANFFLLGYSRHYFILVMLQFYALLPLLVRKSDKKTWLLLSIVVSLISIGYFSHRMYVDGIQTPLIVYAGGLFVWIMFFCLGIFIAKTDRKYKLAPYIICLIISLALSYKESIMYIDKYDNLGGIGYKVSNFIFSFFAIIVLMSKKIEDYVNSKNNYCLNFLKWCGRNSLGLFFIHSPLLLFVFSHINIGNLWFVKFSLCFAVSSMIIIISKKYFSKKLLLSIGFR